MRKILIIWPLLLGLTAAPFLFKPYVSKVMAYGSYYFMLALLIWWIYTFARYIKHKSTIIQQNRLSLGKLVGMGLLFTTLSFVSNEVTFKTNSDETNLMSMSLSMFYSKTAYNETMAKYYYGNYQPFNLEIPTRPLMFPFITSIVHQFFGFSHKNAFVVNFISLWALFFMAGLWAHKYHHWAGALAAMLLVYSHSVFPIYGTSAGFDVHSVVFMLLSLALAYEYTKTKAPEVWQFLVATMAYYVNVRYESLLFAGLICLYLLITRHVSLMDYLKSRSMAMFVLVYQPQVWQRIINVGNYENPEDRGVFSLISVKEHLELYFSFVYKILEPLPYNAILNLLSPLVCLYIIARIIKQKKLKEQSFVVFLIVFVFINTMLFFAHHAGIYDHPTQSRFFMAYCLLGVFVFFYMFKQFDFKYKNYWMVLGALAMFFLYNPMANEGRFINKLTINRELRELYKFILAQPDKNNLYIYDRPGQITALGLGAVSYEWARENWDDIISDYNRGLFSNIFILEQVNFGDEVDYTWNNSPVNVHKNIQVTAEDYVRILSLE